jgi:hypothetical protein
MAAIGTPLEHIAGALWTSADFHGLAVPARPAHLQGNRGIRKVDALKLVMKGSPVRVRASAFGAIAGTFVCPGNTEGALRVRNGYIF